jgi:Tol biopolymer transport system component
MSTRPDRQSAWSTPQIVAELATSDQDIGPFVTSNRLELAFFRGTSEDSFDLFRASRSDAGDTWGTPVEMTDVNTNSGEATPWISDDLLTLYFASNRSGGQGDRDIWVATRSSASAAFEPAVPVDSVNESSRDKDPWVSPDQSVLFFASDRNGNDDLFMSTR